jgi:hypothetical protein
MSTNTTPPEPSDRGDESKRKFDLRMLKPLLNALLRKFCQHLYRNISGKPKEAIAALADQALAVYKGDKAAKAGINGCAESLLVVLGAVLALGSWLNDHAIQHGIWRPEILRGLPIDKKTAIAVHELWVRFQLCRKSVPLNLRATPVPDYGSLLEMLMNTHIPPTEAIEPRKRKPIHPCLREHQLVGSVRRFLKELGTNFEKYDAELAHLMDDLWAMIPDSDRPESGSPPMAAG